MAAPRKSGVCVCGVCVWLGWDAWQDTGHLAKRLTERSSGRRQAQLGSVSAGRLKSKLKVPARGLTMLGRGMADRWRGAPVNKCNASVASCAPLQLTAARVATTYE